MPTMISVTETAKRLGVSRPHIHNWLLRQPDAPRSVKIGRRRLIAEAELDSWLTSRLERAAQAA